MNLRFVEAFYWGRIAALEEELGVLLLDRRDKQFRLTVAGMRFFNHAQRLLALQREIKGEMGAGGAQRAVTLRIGAIECREGRSLTQRTQRRHREPQRRRLHFFFGFSVALGCLVSVPSVIESSRFERPALR